MTIQESCHSGPVCAAAPFPECSPGSKVICPGLKPRLRNRDDSGETKLWLKFEWYKWMQEKNIHEKFIFRIKCSLLTMTWLVILNRNNNTNNHNCYLQGRLYTMRNFHNLCSISTYNWGVANFIMFINDDFPIAGDRFNHISWDYKIHKTIQQLKWGDLKVKRYPQK